MEIDLDALREDLKRECYGAFFGAGIGEALMESYDVDCASPYELMEMAHRWGVNLEEYKI